MIRTSVSETRKQLSHHLKYVSQTGDVVIIHNRGQDEAVIISMKDYELLVEAQKKDHRRSALERLKTIAEQRSAVYDVSEAEEIADEISREAIQRDLE